MKIPWSTRLLLAIGALGAAIYTAKHYQEKFRRKPNQAPKTEPKEAASG